jgi:hypothetical protein
MTDSEKLCEQIERLDREATPGPWSYEIRQTVAGPAEDVHFLNEDGTSTGLFPTLPLDRAADARLIAEFRTLPLELVVEHRKALARIRELEQRIANRDAAYKIQAPEKYDAFVKLTELEAKNAELERDKNSAYSRIKKLMKEVKEWRDADMKRRGWGELVE